MLAKAELEKVKSICESGLIYLSINFPTFAELIIKLGGYNIIEDESRPYCAWTDGKGITINASAIHAHNTKKFEKTKNGKIALTITSRELAFILCHELFHIIGLTYERGKHVRLDVDSPELKAHGLDLHNRIVKETIWNKATDYEINSLLYNNKQDGTNNPIGNLPEWVLYEHKYKDKIAEDIYLELLKDTPKFIIKECIQALKQEGQSNSQKSEQTGDSKGDNNGQSEDNQKEGSSKPSQDDNGSDKESDRDNKQSSGNRQDDNESKSGGLDKKGVTESYPLDEHKDIDAETLEDIAARVNEYKGSTLNGQNDSDALNRLLNTAFKEIPFNWRKALSKYITSYIKGNYSWNTPSRVGIATGLILPASGKTPQLKVAVAVDTSGSISDKELTAMTNHLFSILQQFKHFSIDLWSCGSKVYEETFMTITEHTKKKLKDFEYKSDGGNDMRKNFSFLESHYKQQKPDIFIILSDFYDPLDGDTETTSICPVIFLCIDHKDFKKPTKIKGEVFPFHVHNK